MPRNITPPARPALATALVLDGRPRYKIAAAASVAPNELGGMVSGRVAPTLSQAIRIAEALGLAVDSLFPPEASS